MTATSQPSAISARRLNKLHALALEMNAAHDAALLATAADTVAAIGNPPDAAPVAPVAVRRVPVGDASHVNTSDVHPALTFCGAVLLGTGPVMRRDACTVTPLKIDATHVPALYARAAALLTAASDIASVNAPDRIGASPLDRMQFLSRAAERCILAADRHAPGTRPTRAYSGGYNGTDATRMRIASIRAAIPDVTPDMTLPADACDALVVAHLAARKTATRPDGGYFANNVGTIDRK